MIRLENVCKQFERLRNALTGITLRVRRGEMVAITGPSGSGKSTLLNLIGTLDRPSSGSIHIEDEDVSGLDDRELTLLRREKLGFVFQFFNLLPSLNCEENVQLPLHLRGWSTSDVSKRARELLSLVGLEQRREHLPDELSGGERQRVAIARALVSYPPILLADEPTGNLDSQTGAEILALIHDVRQRLGTTVLLVTHDISVAQNAPRRVTLRDGCIVEDLRR